MKSGNLILIVVMLVVLYVLLILPQRRQQKQRNNMMQQLGPGAKILTAGGMYATVTAMTDTGVRAVIADGVEVDFDNRAVVRVVQGAPASDSTEETAQPETEPSAEDSKE